MNTALNILYLDVTEADVPNAAAAILLDRQKIPQRVIAFNPDFIALVRRETGGNPWAAAWRPRPPRKNAN